MLLSQTALQRKRKIVSGWLHLATWVFLLILIICITMVNFLQFLDKFLMKFLTSSFGKSVIKKNPALFSKRFIPIFCQGQDLTRLVGNRTKLRIPYEIKPPLNDAIINVSEKRVTWKTICFCCFWLLQLGYIEKIKLYYTEKKVYSVWLFAYFE